MPSTPLIWNVTGDEALDVPTTMGITTIWDDWTVTIDTQTVVLNRLTIRGRVYFMPDAGETVELRAHYVRVLGGSLVMGNITHPIQPDTIALLTLHSDRYVKAMNSAVNGNTKIYNEKALDVNGNFSAVGTQPAFSTAARKGMQPIAVTITAMSPGVGNSRPLM